MLRVRAGLQHIRLTQLQAIALLIFCLSLGLSIWQLSVPEFLSAYDSGVYLASTIHLVSGVLPYRDFTFVQPPGILLLMSPIGIFSRVFGTHDGFIMARVVSSVVTALNAGLLAWLVRHRGRLAMAFAGGGLAFLPVSFFVSSSLTLEPYCILFVLLGAFVVLDRDALGEVISYAAHGSWRSSAGICSLDQTVGPLSTGGTRTVPHTGVSATRWCTRDRGGELLHCAVAAVFRLCAPPLLLRSVRSSNCSDGPPRYRGRVSATG